MLNRIVINVTVFYLVVNFLTYCLIDSFISTSSFQNGQMLNSAIGSTIEV